MSSALRAEGIQAAKPAATLRVGFHLYNDEEDADRVADVLRSLRQPWASTPERERA